MGKITCITYFLGGCIAKFRLLREPIKILILTTDQLNHTMNYHINSVWTNSTKKILKRDNKLPQGLLKVPSLCPTILSSRNMESWGQLSPKITFDKLIKMVNFKLGNEM